MSIETIRALREADKHAEARVLAAELAAKAPHDAELQLEAARVHDFLGEEAAAVPYYVAALAGNLQPEQRRCAYLGLGSTYRVLGKYRLAEDTLREGLLRFPDARELETFLAMTLHNLGQSKEAVEALLGLLAETSNDEHIRRYAEAIAFYARDVGRSWP